MKHHIIDTVLFWLSLWALDCFGLEQLELEEGKPHTFSCSRPVADAYWKVNWALTVENEDPSIIGRCDMAQNSCRTYIHDNYAVFMKKEDGNFTSQFQVHNVTTKMRQSLVTCSFTDMARRELPSIQKFSLTVFRQPILKVPPNVTETRQSSATTMAMHVTVAQPKPARQTSSPSTHTTEANISSATTSIPKEPKTISNKTVQTGDMVTADHKSLVLISIVAAISVGVVFAIFVITGCLIRIHFRNKIQHKDIQAQNSCLCDTNDEAENFHVQVNLNVSRPIKNQTKPVATGIKTAHDFQRQQHNERIVGYSSGPSHNKVGEYIMPCPPEVSNNCDYEDIEALSATKKKETCIDNDGYLIPGSL